MSAFVIVIFLLSISSGGSSNDRPVKKCCAIGYLINEGLACESVGNDTDMNIFRILGDDNSTLVTCFQSEFCTNGIYNYRQYIFFFKMAKVAKTAWMYYRMAASST